MTRNEQLVESLVKAIASQQRIIVGEREVEIVRRRTFFSPKQIDLVGFNRGAAKGQLTLTLAGGKKVEVHVEIGM